MANIVSGQDGSTSAFTFDRRTLDALDRLKAELGVTSRVDVIRCALALLDVAVEGAEGKTITLQTKDGPFRIAI